MNNSCTRHREYHDFNGVHVNLRSNCISLDFREARWLIGMLSPSGSEGPGGKLDKDFKYLSTNI